MTRLAYVLALSIVTACAAAPDPADLDAETAPPAADGGKADAATWVGLYHISSSTLHSNDVSDLELHTDGTYVRGRCYHASCASWIPETEHYDVVTSHGRQYVRFWSVSIASDLSTTPALVDTYEIRAISKGIQLRKTYTTRWFSLFHSSISSQCLATGGKYDGSSDSCSCPNSVYSDSGYEAFAAGAGGCIWAPSGSESACDSSGGMYTDDESTAISTFCVCGIGRYDSDDGSCASI
jgi:hypothetical protein